MKNNFDDITYFLTVWFCTTVIVFGIIGLVAKLIIHLNK